MGCGVTKAYNKSTCAGGKPAQGKMALEEKSGKSIASKDRVSPRSVAGALGAFTGTLEWKLIDAG